MPAAAGVRSASDNQEVRRTYHRGDDTYHHDNTYHGDGNDDDGCDDVFKVEVGNTSGMMMDIHSFNFSPKQPSDSEFSTIIYFSLRLRIWEFQLPHISQI